MRVIMSVSLRGIVGIRNQRRHPVIIFDDEKAHVFAGFQGRMIRIRHDVFYQVMTISR